MPGLALLASALALAVPATAPAQVFLASQSHPPFTIGPLFVRATVTPRLGPVDVDILWSLVMPSDRSAADLEQDLFLLWPGDVAGNHGLGQPDPALSRYVEERGFTAIDAGRLPLFAQKLFQMEGDGELEPIRGGAPYVTFVRLGGPLGLTAPATYIRIPWTPHLANRTRLMNLRFAAPTLVKPRQASWLENAFWGQRYLVALSFSDVRPRGLFPMYFEHRDRVVRLAEDPSQLMLNFADADHVKIDQVSPPSSSRKLSETRESTEVVSLFLDRSEGITPQVLTVQFGYFSGWRSWAPVLIPFVFFVLGNLAAPLLRVAGERVGRTLSSRFQLARPSTASAAQDTGVVLPRETLKRIVPGETTADEVLRLCGPEAEVHEDLAAPEHRTLVYRGRHVVPQRRPIIGWLARVSRWDVEHHEVEIRLERSVVRDVQARVRRARLSHPDTPR